MITRWRYISADEDDCTAMNDNDKSNDKCVVYLLSFISHSTYLNNTYIVKVSLLAVSYIKLKQFIYMLLTNK